MDWRTRFAGSRRERVSWVCWPSAWLYFPGTSSSQNLAFQGDKMGGKDHCRVTTGRIKNIKKNPWNVCPLVSVTRQNIAVVADSRMVPCSLLRMKLQVLLLVVVVVVVCFLFFVLPFVCFSSSLLQCTSCALNYYSISLLSEREYVCA